MNVRFVDEGDVFGGSIVTVEKLDVIVLDANCFFDDAVVGSSDFFVEELVPFFIGEFDVVEGFELGAKIWDQFCFRSDW